MSGISDADDQPDADNLFETDDDFTNVEEDSK
jgi:hypothetical protein